MQIQRNKLDFSGQNIYIGFDTHLKKIVMPEQSGKDALNAIVGASKDLRASVLRVAKQINELSKTKAYQE